MRIMIIGGAGLMGSIAVLDLIESSEITEIVIADYREDAAKELASSFDDPRVRGCFIDATNIESMSKVIKGCDAVINSTMAKLNIPVMKACIQAKCHYNDLGGLFHFTRKQFELFDEFKNAGLTAVLCIGSAPGITNIMARYAYDRLDEVETVRLFVASNDLNEAEGYEYFIPPYSIRTVMEEYGLESVQFVGGEYKTLPPLAGELEMVFPDPVGKAVCHHTLHSEPATLPNSFKEKGVKEVSWRLSLPKKFESKAAFLASIGFADKKSINIRGTEIKPIELLETMLEDYLEKKIRKAGITSRRQSILRAQVIGYKKGQRVEYILDCPNKLHSRWGVMCGTSVPPCIAAQMQIRGLDCGPGVWPPELAFDPEIFFAELAKRELIVEETVKKQLI